MTVGLKTPSNYYMELITAFSARPIANEDELIATQNRINEILDREKKTDQNWSGVINQGASTNLISGNTALVSGWFDKICQNC